MVLYYSSNGQFSINGKPGLGQLLRETKYFIKIISPGVAAIEGISRSDRITVFGRLGAGGAMTGATGAPSGKYKNVFKTCFWTTLKLSYLTGILTTTHKNTKSF